MSYITRPCDICGKLMFHVDSRRRTCPKCSQELRDKEWGRPKGTAHTVGESGKAYRRKEEQPDTKPPLKRRVKPITQCVREAEQIGISYGKYVQRGYDKVVLSTVKQKERNRKNGRS